jgi:hypothetical protein
MWYPTQYWGRYCSRTAMPLRILIVFNQNSCFCWVTESILSIILLLWLYSPLLGLGRGISQSQGLYLHTKQHKHRINAHNTDIHALSGIRTDDPSVRASEDSSCLRPRGHCDSPFLRKLHWIAVTWGEKWMKFIMSCSIIYQRDTEDWILASFT